MNGNPSSPRQRIALSFVAAIAALIAIYMGLYQWGLIDHVWDPLFGNSTEKILSSDLSHQFRKWLLIPDAVLGAISYLGDILFSLAGSKSRWKDRPWLVLLFGAYVIPPAAVSMILVALQGTVLKAWCFLCLVSAATSLFLILLSYNEVKVSIVYLYRVWKQSQSKRLVWNTLWGNPSEIAFEVSEHMEKDHVG
ncbi:MAG TPA: vitamin K epoxide reductase family protein [Chlamydiales bacterium]|jgi:uncharacterized membrane protein